MLSVISALSVARALCSLAPSLLRSRPTGTYGMVLKAVNKKSGDIVAIKKMKKKYYSWSVLCVELCGASPRGVEGGI